MKTVVKISLIALLACSATYANSKMKKYDIKSAKIEYSIKSSGSILGMTTKEPELLIEYSILALFISYFFILLLA